MQLKINVHGWGHEAIDIEHAITSLDDAEKIGVQVGRSVRDFLRNVPMRRNGSRMTVNVSAWWAEGEPRAPRNGKRKREKKASAADAAE